MIKALKSINRFLRKWVYVIAHVGSVAKLASNPKDAYTYYPDAPRKSKARVWRELMQWLIRNVEVNTFYYCWGFDRQDSGDQKGYMPYREFKTLRNSQNSAAWFGMYRTSYVCLLKDKYTFYLLLSSLGFPTPKVLGVCIGDHIDWLDTRTTEGIDSMLNRSHLRVFCKTLLGESAEGAFPVLLESGKLLLDGAPVTPAELARRLGRAFIIQTFVEQHPHMAELYPESLNTLRLTTIRKGDDVTLFSACQRIGANGLTRDNWAAGGLFGAIDRETGRLTREFKYQPEFVDSVATKHPQTGVVFEGFEIPYFHEAVRMALELHSFLYGIHSIGWDVAITKDGPIFIEGNDNWVIGAHQAVEGPLRKRFLDTIGPGERGGSC